MIEFHHLHRQLEFKLLQHQIFLIRDVATFSPFVHQNLMALQPFSIQVVQLEPQKVLSQPMATLLQVLLGVLEMRNSTLLMFIYPVSLWNTFMCKQTRS